MRATRKLPLYAFSVILCLTLTGCGDDGGSDRGNVNSSSSNQPAVGVTILDMEFNNTRGDAIEVTGYPIEGATMTLQNAE
jgi:hypothetical protein